MHRSEVAPLKLLNQWWIVKMKQAQGEPQEAKKILRGKENQPLNNWLNNWCKLSFDYFYECVGELGGTESTLSNSFILSTSKSRGLILWFHRLYTSEADNNSLLLALLLCE